MKRLFRTVVSVCLAAAVTLAPVSTGLAASGVTENTTQKNASVESKNEVVYATLGANGSVSSVYVVNQFQLAQAGSVTDYGHYTDVTNLTNTEPVTQQGDTVTFTSDTGNFYYQGDLAGTELPWRVGISYYLDGNEITPDALAGQSGQLEIHITTRQNENVNAAFYENYMLQIALTLDNDTCDTIIAPDATIAIAGKNTAVNFTVMPEKDADVTLSAAVTDFTMDGIQVSGVPVSLHMDLSETDDMISDFEKLADAITTLNDGTGDLADGVADMKEGTDQLADGSADIRDGLSELGENSGKFTKASKQIKKALSTVASTLNDSLSNGINLDDMQQLPAGLTQLANGLTGISEALTQLQTGFATAYTSLDTAIQGIPDVEITEDEINTLYANTDPSQHQQLDKLVASYTAARTVQSTYGQIKGAFDAVNTNIPALTTSIDAMADTLNTMSQNMADTLSHMDILDQLTKLTDGLSELAENYGNFHEGLEKYMDGIGTLSEKYPEFHDGVTALNDGVGDLYDGVVKLHDGTCELRDETADMPDEMQSKIDEYAAEYSGDDFQPVSFVSGQNTNIGLVQFVLKCDGVSAPDETVAAPVDETSETLWDRITALFKGK